MGLGSYVRLFHAGWVLAREGAFSVLPVESLPPMMKIGISSAGRAKRIWLLKARNPPGSGG